MRIKSKTGFSHKLETKIKIGNANRKQIFFFCDYCGRISHDKPSHYKRKERHFCNRKCYSKFRKYEMFREEQNSYGTGYSIEERKRRTKIRSDTNHAIRDKKIVKESCRICGERSQAHHLDYNDPLNVDWLCFKHHRKIHENPELLE